MKDNGSLTLSEYVRRVIEKHVEYVEKHRSMLEVSSVREVV
jgi:predicted DNA-binding protein